MKIKSVSYGRTVSKDYQSKRAEVTVDLERGDTYNGALAQAKTLVMIALDEAPTDEQVKRAREIIALEEAARSVAPKPVTKKVTRRKRK